MSTFAESAELAGDEAIRLFRVSSRKDLTAVPNGVLPAREIPPLSEMLSGWMDVPRPRVALR